jgi:hypothetical protein
VVAAFELHDDIPAGVTPRQADGAHGCLGARVHHTHQIHVRHDVADGVGELDFELRRRTKTQAFLGLFDDRLAHLGMIVSHDHGAPGQHIVGIAFAVYVVDVGAVGTVDKNRRATDGLEGPYRRVNAAGNVLAGADEEFC